MDETYEPYPAGRPETVVVDIRSVGETGRLLRISGDLDMAGVPSMWAAMPDCLDGGVDVDLDLVGVTFLDSAGLNALVTVARRVGGAGGRLRVMSASKAAQRVLDISGVGLLLSVNPAPAGEPHSLRTEP